MAEVGADESASAQVGTKAHLDNAVTMLVLITLFVFAAGGVGRAIGRKMNKPGVVTFFGGN